MRQIFAQKLHKGLSRLRLPLEYMAICALCAKDPVKERRAHARQCLVKNINVRREYLKQHAAVSGKRIDVTFCASAKMQRLTLIHCENIIFWFNAQNGCKFLLSFTHRSLMKTEN